MRTNAFEREAFTVDSGKFGIAPDEVGYFLLSTPAPPEPSCTTGFTLFSEPIFDGDIVVKDANQ